ncbi:MAG: 50S ribosomal protein L3 [Chloroflexi bacterium]|nr:50S ribosomal protein L3 [Chloroflexota bacterium]MQC26469.1 50S ribosomal protein L3 [Chloroflexota bacterium]
MFKGLIGKKIGMTQIFDEEGVAVPITLIEAGPCYVTQVRKPSRDGYTAVQLGFSETREKLLTGGQLGHLKRTDAPSLRYLREFRVKQIELKEGEKITVEGFVVGERVDVISVSKGKGFAGAMKRHGFAGGPITHGQSDRQRSVGSIGATTTPSRVFKGKKMPGRMGNDRVTSQNLKIALVDQERNLIGVHGSVAGGKGAVVAIKEARKE